MIFYSLLWSKDCMKPPSFMTFVYHTGVPDFMGWCSYRWSYVVSWAPNQQCWGAQMAETFAQQLFGRSVLHCAKVTKVNKVCPCQCWKMGCPLSTGIVQWRGAWNIWFVSEGVKLEVTKWKVTLAFGLVKSHSNQESVSRASGVLREMPSPSIKEFGRQVQQDDHCWKSRFMKIQEVHSW